MKPCRALELSEPKDFLPRPLTMEQHEVGFRRWQYWIPKVNSTSGSKWVRSGFTSVDWLPMRVGSMTVMILHDTAGVNQLALMVEM